ncbi:glycosyltransferase family 4 protein [Zwartia sp.]|uniref:glycosyltransferase family 4 protein n=1 Tax=Zwartia sp. TaxID=2978004 RepID=UPI0027162F07|nr:glycosyltransferase family 4 protein [Zwartia sp.]MDO9024478.1 glycosyltransferase family 4 protein [Zwartia sp.]
MKSLIFAYPGDLSTPTGGYIYDRRIFAGLEQMGWHVQRVSLGEGFPFPGTETVERARQTLLELTPGMPIVMDGLALGVLPELIAEVARRHPVIALIHHPLAFESGLSHERVAAFMASETRALSFAVQVIVTSPATARDLVQSFGVPPERIQVVLPGTAPAVLVRERHPATADLKKPLNLLSVGSIVPRKGFDVLLAALQPLAALDWTLTIAGDATRDAHAPAQLFRDITRFGFENRVHVLGAVDDERLESLYQQADAFVLASRFEGYGMAYAEALARGLPVIGTTGGAIPETVPSNAGLLVAPDNVESLTEALRRLMQDAELRSRLSMGAREAALRQPTWQDSTERFAAALSRVVNVS